LRFSSTALPGSEPPPVEWGVQAVAKSHEEIEVLWHEHPQADWYFLSRKQASVDNRVMVEFLDKSVLSYRNQDFAPEIDDAYDVSVGSND
jgi:hypothetical protein